MKKVILFLSGLLFFVSSCDKEKGEVHIYTVGSEMVYRYGVILQPCLVIKEKGQNHWDVIYDGIEGFDYERGYEYVIAVRIVKNSHPSADGSSTSRILVDQISKIQKDSEDLPPIYLDYPTPL